MSTVPAKQTLATESAESIEEKFQRLATLCGAETAYVSSSSDLVADPAVQEIVAMGWWSSPGSENWRNAQVVGTGRYDGSGADPVSPGDLWQHRQGG